MIRVFVGAAALMLCSACSVIKDSKQMKTKLSELDQKGEQIAKRISDVEIEGTFDRSYKSFQEETEKLFAENGKDDVVEADMVIHAKAAINSMLFQFWKGDYADNLAALDHRFALHADLFYARVNGKTDNDKTVNPRIPNRGYKGVAALGAFMHVMRPEYVEALNKNRLQSLSLYDVTVMALRARHANGPQPLLPKTVDKVLEWKQEAVFTLQMRHNYLPLMVAARLGDLKIRGESLSDIRNFLSGVRGKRLSLNDVEPKKIDDRQLKEWIVWLKAAADTRQALREMGFTPEYNYTFAMIFNSLNFGQAGILAQAPAATSSARARLEYEFTRLYTQVGAEMAQPAPMPLPSSPM